MITNDFVVMCVGFFIKVFLYKKRFPWKFVRPFFNYTRPEYSKKCRQSETKMTSTTALQTYKGARKWNIIRTNM